MKSLIHKPKSLTESEMACLTNHNSYIDTPTYYLEHLTHSIIDSGLNEVCTGGIHTLDLELLLIYDDAMNIVDRLEHSTMFTYYGEPKKYKHFTVYRFRPTRKGPRGVYIDVRVSKFPVWYKISRPKDIVYAEPSLSNEPTCSVVIRCNPKVLIGDTNYIEVSDKSLIDDFVRSFNDLCSSISPLMCRIDDYRIRRSDACCNIVLHDLPEVAIDAVRVNGWDGITPWHIVQLIKRGNRLKWYDTGTYSSETDDRSVYMKNPTCRVNIYCKGEQLAEKFPDLEYAELAVDILRVEIQMLSKKLGSLISSKNWNDAWNMIFSEDWNVDVIDRYWKRIVGTGDWWCRELAEKKIRSMGWSRNKTDRLIGVLNLVEMYGGVGKARCRLDGRDRVVFVEGVRELDGIGVNAVLIPVEWKMKWIPNVWEKWLVRHERCH